MIAAVPTPTALDRDALTVHLLDALDMADKWVTTCRVLGLDPNTTTPADLLADPEDAPDRHESDAEAELYPGYLPEVPLLFRHGIREATT